MTLSFPAGGNLGHCYRHTHRVDRTAHRLSASHLQTILRSEKGNGEIQNLRISFRVTRRKIVHQTLFQCSRTQAPPSISQNLFLSPSNLVSYNLKLHLMYRFVFLRSRVQILVRRLVILSVLRFSSDPPVNARNRLKTGHDYSHNHSPLDPDYTAV
jgi:hypothetical protein